MGAPFLRVFSVARVGNHEPSMPQRIFPHRDVSCSRIACLALVMAFFKKCYRLYSTTYRIDFAQNCALCTRLSLIQVVMQVHHFGWRKHSFFPGNCARFKMAGCPILASYFCRKGGRQQPPIVRLHLPGPDGPCSLRTSLKSSLAYWLPRSLWKSSPAFLPGWRANQAISSASITKLRCISGRIDQPTILRLNKPVTVAAYSRPH